MRPADSLTPIIERMGLDIGRIKHTLGIAEHHAPNLPMERDLLAPAMVKHGHGWGAVTGIVAAELGDEYIMLPGVSFKQFCSCGWGHHALSAIQKLQREHDLDVKDISTIGANHLSS